LHKPITSLSELAKILGVSVSTASRALRNHPSISALVREKANTLAKEQGFTPSLALSRAGSKRWRSAHEGGITIALLMWKYANETDLPGGSRIRRFAASLGYRVEMINMGDFSSPAEAGRVLKNRGIEAVLAMRVYDEVTIREFPWEDFCAVGIMPGYYRPPIPVVIPDMELCVARALREAYAKGYRRPGLALYSELVPPIDDFEKKRTLEHLLHQPAYADCGRIPFFEAVDGSVMPTFGTWLKKHRPDVVIGQTAGYYWDMLKHDYRVPKDTGFISLNIPIQQLNAENEVTGLIIDTDNLTQTTIQILDAKLRHFDHAQLKMAATIRLEMPWNEGTTLPVRQSPAR
jgi:hypothetical protein